MSSILYRLDIHLNEKDCELAEALLFEYIQYGWEEENLSNNRVLIRLHCEFKNTIEEIKECLKNSFQNIEFFEEEIENQDWTEAWKQYFTPVEAGKFIVLPSWEKDKETKFIPIYIEPKSAFGTGHHATTALCLHAISQLAEENKIQSDMNFLDLGCGTAILGLACHKLGLTGLCTDIDPIAIANSDENLILNDVKSGIELEVGSIEVVKDSYDIVIANILAGPLKVMAEEIISKIKTNGLLVLSGILSSQADDVIACYSKLGAPKVLQAQDIPHLCPENIATNEIKPAETWVALIFEK